MILNATVAKAPGRRAFCSFSDKSILYLQSVILEFLIIIDRTKLVAETIILIVPYAEDSILDTKCISEIFTERITCYFNFPVIEVFTVEQADPFLQILPGIPVFQSVGN